MWRCFPCLCVISFCYQMDLRNSTLPARVSVVWREDEKAAPCVGRVLPWGCNACTVRCVRNRRVYQPRPVEEKCKDRLANHINTPTFLTFMFRLVPHLTPAMPMVRGRFWHDSSRVLAPVFPFLSTKVCLAIVTFLGFVCRRVFSVPPPRHTGGTRQVFDGWYSML